jgi:hypothetical protein
MKVSNVHERKLRATPEQVGALIDSLASPQDALWPADRWPPMRLDRPLSIGAAGGHGPIRYAVEAYAPGRSVTFRFTGHKGFDGIHRFDVLPAAEGVTLLRHTLEVKSRGAALVTWLLVIRPLHDALLEDALDRAEASLGLPARRTPWSFRVRFLRRALAGRRARSRQWR